MRRLIALAALSVVSGPPVSAQTSIPAEIERAVSLGSRTHEGQPGRAYWQLRPTYFIAAELVPDDGVLNGELTLSFQNTSPTPLDSIFLRLDQNHFAGPDSPVPTRGIELESLSVGGRNVINQARFTDPTRTVLGVPLSSPIAPGESATVSVRWQLDIPEDPHGEALRQGRWGDRTFQLGQWYPRLAMYDDVLGWDIEPHYGFAEFNAHFADYDVEVRVPDGWLVGATGTLTNPEEALSAEARARLGTLNTSAPGEIVQVASASSSPDGRLRTWKYTARLVRDFAWATSADFTWTAVRTQTGTQVHGFVTPRHTAQYGGAVLAAGRALDRLNSLLGPANEAQTHVLVDGPEGGMEYPGLTMSHGDGRTNHEISHQWFPMTVGTDESRYAFLDEGLASFLPALINGSEISSSSTGGIPSPLIIADNIRTVRAVLGYGRGRAMMEALVVEFGREAVINGLADFVMAWRQRHPTPWDFMNSFERSLGAELDSFWEEWVFSARPAG